MASRAARLGALILALTQFGVAGFYAPAHRLLHHSLRPMDSGRSSISIAGCHSGCCHHRATKSDSRAVRLRDERTPPVPCPDDEDHCAWCAVALQHSAPVASFGMISAVDRVESVLARDQSPIAVREARAFDVRGPPIL
jgi:hypothetical protein